MNTVTFADKYHWKGKEQKTFICKLFEHSWWAFMSFSFQFEAKYLLFVFFL